VRAPWAATAKYLGVHVDSALSWNDHLTKLCTKLYPILCFFKRLSHFLSHETLLNIYKQSILPAIDYGSIIWIDCSKVMSDILERLRNQALRSILKKDRKTCTQWLREKCHLLLETGDVFYGSNLLFKIVKCHNCPKHLENYLATRARLRLRPLRDDSLLNIPTARSIMGKRLFSTLLQRIGIDYPKNLGTWQILHLFRPNYLNTSLILTKLAISAQ